jgi:hypothetical protein
MHLDRVVLDDLAGPNPRHQIVLGHEIAAGCGQRAQNVESSHSKRDAGPIAR